MWTGFGTHINLVGTVNSRTRYTYQSVTMLPTLQTALHPSQVNVKVNRLFIKPFV